MNTEKDFEKIDKLLKEIKLKEPPEKIWDNVYNKIIDINSSNSIISIFRFRPVPVFAVIIPILISLIMIMNFSNLFNNSKKVSIQTENNYIETHLTISMKNPLVDRVSIGVAMILNESGENESE